VYDALEDIQWTRQRREQQQQRVRFVDLRNSDQRSVRRRGSRHCHQHYPRDDCRQAAPPPTTTTATPPTPTTTEKVCRPVKELRQLASSGDERVSAKVFQGQHGVAGQAVGPRTGRQLRTDGQ